MIEDTCHCSCCKKWGIHCLSLEQQFSKEQRKADLSIEFIESAASLFPELRERASAILKKVKGNDEMNDLITDSGTKLTMNDFEKARDDLNKACTQQFDYLQAHGVVTDAIAKLFLTQDDLLKAERTKVERLSLFFGKLLF